MPAHRQNRCSHLSPMRVKDEGSRSWLVRALILVWNNAQTEPPGFRAGAVSGNFPVRLTHGREAQTHMRIVCCISHSDGSLTCGIPKLILVTCKPDAHPRHWVIQPGLPYLAATM